jgi:tellurite resistance protein TerC
VLATLATASAGGGGGSDENFVSFHVEPWIWAAFVALGVVLLLADLFLFHREAHVISTREAAVESAVWIGMGLAFSLVFLFWQGGDAAGEYLAGYLIEKSLSVDNVFVWALILSYFAVPRQYQHRVLFWGIFGALVLRAIFIFAGVALLEAFHWIIYVFGGILIFTAVRLLFQKDEEVHPEQNPVLRVVRRVVPSTSEYHGQKLFWRDPDTLRRLATPLFAVLIVIETSDVIFAVDSIPAILAVAREPFIVFSSNAFAILGLRALYFLLADLKDRFEYLKEGLAVILIFVGVKMVISEWYHIPTFLSLGVIAVILTVSIVVSMKVADRRPDDPDAEDPLDAPDELAS